MPLLRHAICCGEFVSPTRVRLSQRHVDCILDCPLCNVAVEDDYHAFVTCSHITPSWAVAGLSHILMHRLSQFNNVAGLLFDICSNEDYSRSSCSTYVVCEAKQ
jgi:hypothetical protein